MSRRIDSFAHVLLPVAVAMLLSAPAGSSAQPLSESTSADVADAPESTTGDVVARVNGEPVYAQDIESGLQSLHGAASAERAPSGMDVDKLMFRVVNDVLLAQEARALEVHEDPAIMEKVAIYRQKLITAQLTRETIGDRAEPSDEEVAAVCRERNRAVTLRVVTAYKRDDAEALLEELEGGADMEALAREKSVDPYAIRGGLVDQVPRLDLQRDIAEVAFNLEPGVTAGPIRTDLGYSIIRVESFIEADTETLEKYAGGCRQVLRMLNQKEIKAELAAQARERSPVVTDPEIIAAITPQELPDGRLMPQAPDKEAVVARIGESQVVTVREYTKALVGRWKGVRNVEAAIAAAPIVLNGLIDDKVLLAEAIRQGYEDRPDMQRVVRAYETQLLVPAYLEDALGNAVRLTAEDVEAYYLEHRDSYHKPPKIRLGQITVATLEEAERIATQLRAGADLAWLARQHSRDKYAATAGDRGWYSPVPGMEDFNEQLFTAETGTVLDPFGVPGTYMILKVMAREEQGIYDLAEISGNVRAQAEQAASMKVLDAFIEKLRQRAEIDINDELLARLTMSGQEPKPAGAHGAASGAAEGHGE